MEKTTQDAPKWWWGRPGFYENPTENGIEITAEYRDQLLQGQENGYEITENEDGYPVLTEPGPKTFDEWRAAKLARITEFDSSDLVNRCYVDGRPAWFDKATRSGLRSLLDAAEAAGETVTTLWLDSQPPQAVEMPVDAARKMLSAIELYSKAVFDITQRHRTAVHAMSTIDEIRTYDHTAGYPDKLQF